jgi:hypothetical protein
MSGESDSHGQITELQRNIRQVVQLEKGDLKMSRNDEVKYASPEKMEKTVLSSGNIRENEYPAFALRHAAVGRSITSEI